MLLFQLKPLGAIAQPLFGGLTETHSLGAKWAIGRTPKIFICLLKATWEHQFISHSKFIFRTTSCNLHSYLSTHRSPSREPAKMAASPSYLSFSLVLALHDSTWATMPAWGVSLASLYLPLSPKPSYLCAHITPFPQQSENLVCRWSAVEAVMEVTGYMKKKERRKQKNLPMLTLHKVP